MKKPSRQKKLRENRNNKTVKANNRKAVQPAKEKPVVGTCMVQLLGHRWKGVTCMEPMELSVAHNSRNVPLCGKHWRQVSDSNIKIG
jgi:hypothetical protein